MTTLAKIGYGTLFKVGDGATPEVFTALAEVTSITPPKFSRDSIDVSHEQSPGSWKEFIAGLKDGGDVKIEMNFVPGGTAATELSGEFDLDGSAAVKNRQIVFPDGSTFAFAAFITGWDPDAPLDKAMTASATFKITGKPTLTQA